MRALDAAVLASLLALGGACPVDAIWRSMERTLFDGRVAMPTDVALALRRLSRAGLVRLHDGHGTLAVWRPGVRCRYWSTVETIRRDYGYSDADMRLRR